MPFQQYNVYDGLTACRVVATTNQSGTYVNGQLNNGVGATFTYATGVLTIDSVVIVQGDSVALVAQTSANQNGLYICTQTGAVGVSAVLTRRADMQCIEQLKIGQFCTIGAGTVSAGSEFVVVEPLPARFGIDNLVFTAMIPAGSGTASTKAASDNAQPTVASVSGATTTGNILKAADTAGTVSDGGLAANKVLTSGITTPDVSIDLVSFDVTVGQAALAAAGHVALITSSGAKQYKIRSLQLNSGGTNFSGGGGDRLGQVSDGTTVYSVVPAATMQSLVNAQWGVTALPNPASAALNTSTAAGANLFFAYSGGSADYTTGSLVITGIAQRVA